MVILWPIDGNPLIAISDSLHAKRREEHCLSAPEPPQILPLWRSVNIFVV